MKKLFKKVSKVLSISLLLCSVEIQPSGFSKELTDQFVNAVTYDRPEDALRMLNDPAIVSQIDVNAKDSNRDTALICACLYGYQGIVEKLLELRKSDGALLVDVNARGFCDYTPLMYACWRGRQGIVEKLLELRKSDGSLLVDVNAEDRYGNTLLADACFCGYQEIVKTLLLHGADVTMLSRGGNLHTLSESPEKKNILSVFDALKPGIKDLKRTPLEKFIVLEYEKFLQGNHADLRNLLLVIPDMMIKRMNGDHLFIDSISGAMHYVFKKESIKPLLYFLAEKKYQRNMADDFVNRMEREDQESLEFDSTNAAIRERSVQESKAVMSSSTKEKYTVELDSMQEEFQRKSAQASKDLPVQKKITQSCCSIS